MLSITRDLHKVPVLRLLVPFCIGIIISRHCTSILLNQILAFQFASWLLLLLVYWIAYNYTVRQWFGITSFIVLVGVGLMVGIHNNDPIHFDVQDEQECFTGYLSAIPQEKSNSTLLEITITASENRKTIKPFKILAYLEKGFPIQDLQPGVWCVFNANLVKPESNTLETEFDYAKYLQSQHIYFTTYLRAANLKVVETKPARNMHIYSLLIQQKVLNIFRGNGLKGEELALLSALTVGVKSFIVQQQKEAYSNSGAMHVLAVSGLHVGILYGFLFKIFGWIQKSRKGRILFVVMVILLLFSFAAITGFSTSVTRAVLMFSLIAIGNLFNRQHHMLNTIAFSAFVLLLFDPMALFSPGFQLSYSAVCGIVLLFKPLSQKISISNNILKWIVDLVLVSLIAQLVTLHFTVYYFHQFAVLSVLSNLLVIPLVVILLNSIVPALLFGLLGIHPAWLWKGIDCIAMCMNKGVLMISQIPISHISGMYMSTFGLILVLSSLFCALMYLYYYKKKMLLLALLLMVVFAASEAYAKWYNYKQLQFVVYNNFGNTIILVQDQNEGYIISSDSTFISGKNTPVWFYAHKVKEKNIHQIHFDSNLQTKNWGIMRGFVYFPNHIFSIEPSTDNNSYEVSIAHLQDEENMHLNANVEPKSEHSMHFDLRTEARINYLNQNQIASGIFLICK